MRLLYAASLILAGLAGYGFARLGQRVWADEERANTGRWDTNTNGALAYVLVKAPDSSYRPATRVDRYGRVLTTVNGRDWYVVSPAFSAGQMARDDDFSTPVRTT